MKTESVVENDTEAKIKAQRDAQLDAMFDEIWNGASEIFRQLDKLVASAAEKLPSDLKIEAIMLGDRLLLQEWALNQASGTFLVEPEFRDSDSEVINAAIAGVLQAALQEELEDLAEFIQDMAPSFDDSVCANCGSH